MQLTIKKTSEETIEINGLPKFFKHPYSPLLKFYKLTEEGLLCCSKNMIYFQTKENSKYFADEVIEIMAYEEATENEFKDNLRDILVNFNNK
jgi:hypothetical protein